MQLAWLELTDFRSYRHLEWSPDPGVNLLIGPNGSGKTNALEAVGYLATVRSFRGVTDEVMVADGAEHGYLRGAFDRGEERGRALVETQISRRGARRTQLDHQRLRRASDLLEVARIVTFLPEDLDIIKRGPSRRRDLLDEAAAQLRPTAALDFIEYDRALRQRNAFLKQGAPDSLTLSVWDERVSQAGGRVMARRASAMAELGPYFEAAYREISGTASSLTISYRSEWGASVDAATGAADQGAMLAEAIAVRQRHDIERRVTSVGPHRDDPVLVLDGHDVRIHGSQGEQRTTALALRLAVHQSVTDRLGRPPILLLDDVFSELDEGRAHRLAAALPPAQTMISSARPEDVPVRGRRWQVGDGKLSEEQT